MPLPFYKVFGNPSTILLGSTTLNLAFTTVAIKAKANQFSTSSVQSPLLINTCSTIRTNQQQILSIQNQPKQTTKRMFSKQSMPDGSSLPKGKSQEEWRTVLSPAQFKVLREAGTERAFTHEYENNTKDGVYNCAACETPLYKSTTKFKSGCGWPAFFDAIPGAVKRNVDKSLGMKRIEIRCAACDSHLGHVFEGEGFNTPTDERHCVNGISLRFTDEDKGKI